MGMTTMKKFFVLALSAVIFAACSNDHDSDDDNGNGGNGNQGDAWLALSIQTPSGNNLRGLNTPDREDGTPAETDLTTVRAIFFNSSNMVTNDLTLTTAQIGTPGQPTSTKPGEAFKVSSTATNILIVANAPNEFPASTVGMSYATVNAAIEANVSTITGTNKFMMTNAKGDLEPSEGDGTTKALTLYTSSDLAKGTPLKINIDRVAAKVRVIVETASDIANVTTPEWVLNVTNKKYYPVSKRTLTWNENPANTTLGAEGTCRSPFDQYEIGSYRIDPNFGTQTLADYNIYKETNKPAAWKGTGDSEYCLENTQEEQYNVHAYTTQVLLKAQFLPKTYGLPDGSTSSVQEGSKDWIKINGGFFTYTTLLVWIKEELTKKYDAPVPADYDTPITDDLNSYIGEIGLTPVTLSNLTADMDAFTALQSTIEGKADKAGTYGNLTYYAGGINYYKIMIKHDDTDDAFNKLGEFGVVRNSVYDVKVTKFNNPGYPVIPEPDPNTPDEENLNWLAVQININPWTYYSQEVEL